MKAYLLQHLQRVCRCFKVRLNKPSRNLSKWFVKFFTILCIYDGMNHHQYLLSEEQDLSLFSPVHSSLPASQRQSPWASSPLSFPMVSWTAKIQTVILERDFQHPQLRCSVMPTVPRQENVFLCHKTITSTENTRSKLVDVASSRFKENGTFFSFTTSWSCMVFATPNNLFEAVVWCMWSFDNVVGSFENSLASWTMGSTTHKNKECCLFIVWSHMSKGSQHWRMGCSTKKIHNYFFHFNFQIH